MENLEIKFLVIHFCSYLYVCLFLILRKNESTEIRSKDTFFQVLQKQRYHISKCKLFPYRSSHLRCSIEIGVLKNLFLKVAGFRPGNLVKKRLWHRCFPVNFVKFLRTPFLQNTSRRLILSLI